MATSGDRPIQALLFGLSDEIAGALLAPLRSICSVGTTNRHSDVAASGAEVIFCGPDTQIIEKLRAARPSVPIIVVSKDAEVSNWLDSMEAGASDYCVAPFEAAQVKWVVDSSLRSTNRQ